MEQWSNRFLAVLIACWFVAPAAHAQDTPVIEQVLAKLENYAGQYPNEKVYLHLDKPYYTVGDDIWLKGYVTIGAYNHLSGLSKILYVELISPVQNCASNWCMPGWGNFLRQGSPPSGS